MILVYSSTANPLLPIPLTGAKVLECTPTDHSSEITLLTRRLAAGQEQAFAEFHARYFDRLYQFLLVVTRGNEHEAQDALQQTFLRVIRYARSFDSEETFWCWLKAVARSTVRDAGRRKQRYASLLSRFAHLWPGVLAADPLPDGDAFLRASLVESLAELNHLDRELLEGKYVDGTSIKELSAQTGLTEKAVESRLLRLRRRLRLGLLKKLKSE